MKWKIGALSLAALSLPGIALAQTAPKTFGDLANNIVQILSSATVDLIVLAIVIYFWGVSSSIFKGEKGRENLKQQLIWGALVLFFAVSIWGIITILQSSLFGDNGSATGGTSGGASGGFCTSINCQFGSF
ncbi:MAG TPA: hypothetical protein VG102_03545 [Candidatus Paceibacterota bacterium]|jgi:hypothetical protein|nr:hypothetical protein [Candidatus Paceibacterota bacterium]